MSNTQLVLSKNLYPNTEVSVDLKLLTRRPGRMKNDEQLSGTLSRNSEEHFTFMQDTLEKESTPKKSTAAPTRYPHEYEGCCFNVSRRADGNLYPTFCQPHYSEHYTFPDFCREAAEELLMVARTFENSGLVEESIGK